MSEQKMIEQEAARLLMGDGAVGDFIREEIGMVGCDDTKRWIATARDVQRQLGEYIAAVKRRMITEIEQL